MMEIIYIVGTLLVGVLFGFILQRGRFCMVSAFRDPLVMKEYNLLKAVAIAIAVEMIGFLVLVGVNAIPALNPKPFNVWANIIGGLVFGFGAAIAGGCASGTTYRIGEGMVGSFVAMLGLAIFGIATATSGGLLNWISVELNNFSIGVTDGGDLINNNNLTLANIFGSYAWIHILLVIIIVVIIGVLIFWHTKKKSDYEFKMPDNIIKSIFKDGWNFWVTGIAIGVVGIIAFAINFWAGKLYPLGITGGWNSVLNITFKGWNAMNVFTWIVLGAVVGAAIAALIAGEFKFRAPKAKTLLKQFLGGGLMGFGAAVAGGCNIGHGLSGVPMLSIGSIITLGFIIIGIWIVSYFLFMRE
ncbi:MAG: YeeE/YedE family protein [Candidatus Lokiarchaeota archaeon]|nr:YeeE/YedE family protein [Candidatus Lokiarchaeota archaeon]